MKYHQGEYGVWVFNKDTSLYMGTGAPHGKFRIERCPVGISEKITREQAIEFCSKWPEAIAKINELDPIEPKFVPHTDFEQLEIVKARYAGKSFTKIDANGQSSPHDGPFNFVNYRYAEVAKTLEQEVEEFLAVTMGGLPDSYHTADCPMTLPWSTFVNFRKAFNELLQRH